MPRVRGVIFDVDGTLIDSNEGHTWAWVDALAEGGHDIPYGRIRPLIGMGGDNILPRVIGIEKDTPEGKHLSDLWQRHFLEKYLPKSDPLPGARQLVDRIRAEGYRIAVATSSGKDLGAKILGRAGIPELADELPAPDSRPRSKPDPDTIHAALDFLGLPADQTVMVGDTPYDIQAAHKAGVRVVAFRSGGFSDADLEGALALYDGPADLLEHFDRSPLGNAAPSEDGGDA